jgi:putative endonuclease
MNDYYELGDSFEGALAREKQIKGWNRQKKEDLINSINPTWQDLYKEII